MVYIKVTVFAKCFTNHFLVKTNNKTNKQILHAELVYLPV